MYRLIAYVGPSLILSRTMWGIVNEPQYGGPYHAIFVIAYLVLRSMFALLEDLNFVRAIALDAILTVAVMAGCAWFC